MDLDNYTSEGEAKYARKLIRAILAKGHKVSISDSEEWTVKGSTDFDEITRAMASTGMDTVRVRDADKAKLGDFMLIYQNGEGDEVIADYSANDFCEAIWNEVCR